jgi:hypothetical protein
MQRSLKSGLYGIHNLNNLFRYGYDSFFLLGVVLKKFREIRGQERNHYGVFTLLIDGNPARHKRGIVHIVF